jgi:hypothetical protein
MSDERRRQDATLRELMIEFEARHLETVGNIGSYPEKVRLALADELKTDERWRRARDQQGDRIIVDLFMSTVWGRSRSTPESQNDNRSAAPDVQGDIPGLLPPVYIDGRRQPETLTYRDNSAGRTALRTVAIRSASIWQRVQATTYKREKAIEFGEAVARDEAADRVLLSRAGNDLNAKLIDHCDDAEDEAA